MRKIMSSAFCAFTPGTRRRTAIAATEAALWNLHRVMAIKDEVYVAYLLSSEEKYEQDRDRYNVRPELGDRMIHRHLNRPEFTIGKTHPPLQAQDPAMDAPSHAPGEIPAPPAPRLACQGTGVPLVVLSISPINSSHPPIRLPTRRGSRFSACPRKPPATAKSAIPEWTSRKSGQRNCYPHLAPR